MSASTPTLMGLPPELRLQIFKDVLATDFNDVDELYYHDEVIGPTPAVMRTCRQLRRELGPLYFKDRTVCFDGLGHLGTALLLAPCTVPFWQNIQIGQIGRRILRDNEKHWRLEHGLKMLAKIPNLGDVSLDLGSVKCEDMWSPKSDEQLFEITVDRITNQIKLAIPDHPKLPSFHLLGVETRLHAFKIRREYDEIAEFERVYRLRNGLWELEEEFITRL